MSSTFCSCLKIGDSLKEVTFRSSQRFRRWSDCAGRYLKAEEKTSAAWIQNCLLIIQAQMCRRHWNALSNFLGGREGAARELDGTNERTTTLFFLLSWVEWQAGSVRFFSLLIFLHVRSSNRKFQSVPQKDFLFSKSTQKRFFLFVHINRWSRTLLVLFRILISSRPEASLLLL